jgi:hypothetical protein
MISLGPSACKHNQNKNKNTLLLQSAYAWLPGENCLWQFARKSSDENLFSITKFRGRRMWRGNALLQALSE